MTNQLPPDIVDALLDRLSTDDEFRAVFQTSPRIALEALGYQPAKEAASTLGRQATVPVGAWACLTVSNLASKEAIRSSRDSLRNQLLSSHAAHSPVNLETK